MALRVKGKEQAQRIENSAENGVLIGALPEA
jgi:hypothetical protein